jgi:hypothetical protein
MISTIYPPEWAGDEEKSVLVVVHPSTFVIVAVVVVVLANVRFVFVFLQRIGMAPSLATMSHTQYR